MLKRIVFVIIGCLFFPLTLHAFDQQMDLRVSGGTGNYSTDYSDTWSLIGNIYARYTLQNEDNSKIRGVFALEANAGDQDAFFGLYQAYIRVRFNDVVRMTFGKAPLTWGEGMYYNAGDIFYDSSNTGIVLSSLEIRDNSQWLTDMYITLGRYAYFQVVAIFPTLNYYTTFFRNFANQIPGVNLPPEKQATIKDSSAGWRLGTKVGGNSQIQIGGAYKGESNIYTSFFSLTAGIADIMDMYLDTRISVGPGIMRNGDFKKTWEITGGLYYTTAVDAGILTVRVETIFRPYQNWHSIQNPNTVGGSIIPDGKTAIGLYDYYGNEVFFEIGGDVTSFFNIDVRNILSTIDVSDYMSWMFNFTPIDKLTLSVNVGIQLGEKNDLFSFRKAGATSIYFMARYVYE